MNARVCLLVLVTAGFMAIWDADRPVAGRAAVAQSNLQNAVVSFADAVTNSPPLVAAKHSHTSQDKAAASATATNDGVILLPKNLLPGTWHAISRCPMISLDQQGHNGESCQRSSKPRILKLT